MATSTVVHVHELEAGDVGRSGLRPGVADANVAEGGEGGLLPPDVSKAHARFCDGHAFPLCVCGRTGCPRRRVRASVCACHAPVRASCRAVTPKSISPHAALRDTRRDCRRDGDPTARSLAYVPSLRSCGLMHARLMPMDGAESGRFDLTRRWGSWPVPARGCPRVVLTIESSTLGSIPSVVDGLRALRALERLRRFSGS